MGMINAEYYTEEEQKQIEERLRQVLDNSSSVVTFVMFLIEKLGKDDDTDAEKENEGHI